MNQINKQILSRYTSIISNPIFISFLVAAIFSIRFIECLPFSNDTRVFNEETAPTTISYLIYAKEDFSFPIGEIRNIGFPFSDGNVGNVGAMPLFAIAFKALGKLLPYFQTFDYFVFIEIFSSFFTAYFALKIFTMLGIGNINFRLLGALLLGTSFIMLIRSNTHQPFCVVMFPLFMAWIYSMLVALQKNNITNRETLFIATIFPITTLIDNYTFVGIVLGTSAIGLIEFYEAYFGGLASSWQRFFRILFVLIIGILLSIFSLYIIGMYPLPTSVGTFTSYDFGMGGRYHVADLFSPIIPIGENHLLSSSLSLFSRSNYFPTISIANGHYLGLSYIGTSSILLWSFIIISALFFYKNTIPYGGYSYRRQFKLCSAWKKIGIATIFVFIFSLGYELHIFGKAFPNFNLMPAAWLSDRFPILYNIRATNRLATLFSLFITIQGIRLIYEYYISNKRSIKKKIFSEYYKNIIHIFLVFIVIIHLFEILPLLRPVPSQASHPIADTFSDDGIRKLKALGKEHDVVLIIPSVNEVNYDVKWGKEAYALTYYLGLPSNLALLARISTQNINKRQYDLNRVKNGEWDSLINEYGKVMFAMPNSMAHEYDSKIIEKFHKIKVGPVTLWSKEEY